MFFQIVVSKYNENIEWIRHFDKTPFIVYNKGNYEDNYINLPNIGREAHTFYTHIYENYDQLATFTVFLQGNPFDHCHNLFQHLDTFFNKKEHSVSFFLLADSVSAFTLDGCPHHENLPIRQVYRSLFPNIFEYPFDIVFGHGGQFVVKKDVILRHPRKFYKKIITLLDHSVDPIEGYVLERFHKVIFQDIFYWKKYPLGNWIHSANHFYFTKDDYFYATLKTINGDDQIDAFQPLPDQSYMNDNGSFRPVLSHISLPQGSWIESASDFRVHDGILYANLRDHDGQSIHAKTLIEFQSSYDNINGHFHKTKNTLLLAPYPKNSYIVMLTTAVRVGEQHQDRLHLYIRTIEKWLNNTLFEIYVVESTGVDLSQYISHKRFHFLGINLFESFPQKKYSSSFYESHSLLALFDQFKKDDDFISSNCTHILKVTGKYFLYGIHQLLDEVLSGADLYLQIHRLDEIRWQNTEYFAIKKDLLPKLCNENIATGLYIEHTFYNFRCHYDLSSILLGPFPNKDRIERGDGSILEYL